MHPSTTIRESVAVAMSLTGASRRYCNGRGLGPVSLEFTEGQVCSVLGSNGSGKSTLLRCLSGFEALDSGQIARPPKSQIGIVFQNVEPWPHLRVWENVAVPLRYGLHLDEAEVEMRVSEELERFGIADRCSAMPFQLSGGIRQRVVLARAFALRPRLLLLDEVTSALDPEWTERVRDIVRRFAARGGTVLSVSHRINLVRRMSDTVVFLDDGKVVAHGSVDLLAAPTDPRFARFLENA